MIRSRLPLLAARALDSAPASAALRVLERADRGADDILAVLTYHRVADADAVRGFPGLVSASPSEFDEQMAFMARRYRVVALDDVLEARETGRPLGRRAVLVTFDDAYLDFAEHAWPVLRRRKLPVTLFVPTAYPGQPDRSFWWDWLHEAIAAAPLQTVLATPDGPVHLTTPGSRRAAYRRLRGEVKRRSHAAAMDFVTEIAADQLGLPPPPAQVLDWPELQELAADGVTLAPHTRTHPLLDRLDAAELDAELGGSYADLERQIGTAPPALAYPSGSYSNVVRDAAADAGFKLGFTTRRGLNQLGRTDWLALRRINVGRASSLNVLRAQLGRWTLAGTR